MRVGLATCAAYPDLDDDDRLLLPAFRARGALAVPAVWDDPAVDWAGFDLVVIRETWDYPERLEAFLAWLDRVAAVTTVLNPPALARWSTDKTYLGELAGAGVPVVPTTYLPPDADAGTLQRALDGGGEVVVKPTVSAGSRDTARHDLDDTAPGGGRAAAEAHVRRLHAAGRTAMVQPYLASVDDRGETALLHVDGVCTHAIRKGPLLRPGAEPTDSLFAEEDIAPRSPTASERVVAQAVMAAVPASLGAPLYARVDLLAGPDGPVLLELELVEPSLFLRHGGDAADRLAAAALAHLA